MEFNYQITQAYDFLVLYREHGCTLQLGGDDQWGNIVAGVDLIRRVERAPAEGITWPLLTTANGEKMGKTAAGAVWLSADKTSPFEYYQFWINSDDRDVGRFLAYYTFLPMSEVAVLGKLQGAEIRSAKQVLAFEATKITHGEEEAMKARHASESAFGGDGKDLDAIPTSNIPRSRVAAGVLLIDLLAETGLTASKGNARRLVQQGGAYLNDAKIESIEARLSLADLDDNSVLIRAGKKRYHRLIIK